MEWSLWYVDVRWVASLPWYAGVVATFVEMKAKADGKVSGNFIAKYLKDTCSQFPE